MQCATANSMPFSSFQMPLDLTTLSESEIAARLLMRKPKEKIVIEEDFEDSFDLDEYKHLWSK